MPKLFTPAVFTLTFKYAKIELYKCIILEFFMRADFMKKHGFTLAEVLVTLGIIGVVAALTTPALIQNVGNAKVGPKLQKAVATFETASEMMLTDQNSNSLIGIATSTSDLCKALSQYMKINKTDAKDTQGNEIKYKNYTGNTTTNATDIGTPYASDEGMIYYIRTNGASKEAVHGDYADIPNNQRIGDVYVDINGNDGPNVRGKDLFRFALYNDGTLRAWGSRGFLRHHSASGITNELWSSTLNTCNKDHVKGSGDTCTGSIFDNGMKIIYQ